MTKKAMIDEMVDNGYLITYGPKETKESLKKYLYRNRLKEQIEERYSIYLTIKEKRGKWKLPFFILTIANILTNFVAVLV